MHEKIVELPPAIVVKLGVWGRAAAASDPPGSAVAETRSATLNEVNEEIIALLQAGKLGAARDLTRQWNRSARGDHRKVSPLDAQRWALTRELVDVARRLPGPLRRAIARGIALDDLTVAYSATESYQDQYPSRADKLAQDLWNRAPALHKALGARLQSRVHSGNTGEQSGRASFRWVWLAVVLVSALGRASNCDEHPRMKEFRIDDTAAPRWTLPPSLPPRPQHLGPLRSEPQGFDRTLTPPTLELHGRSTTDDSGRVEPRPQ